MPHIVLLATGGTIASRAKTQGGAVTAGLTGDTLLNSLHSPLPETLTVTVENFEAKGSYALDLATVYRLCQRIDALLASDAVDGIVVTHGTDTMEESAFLAWLLVHSPKPVVFTGAQRHAGEPDTDGPRNIHDAILAAAAPALHDLGAVIVFEGDIHGARYVTKTHTARTDTFRSNGHGKLGEIDLGDVHLYTRPAHPRRPLAVPALDPDVELIALGLGTTPRLMTWAKDNGASGIVLAAFGRGNAPQGFAEATRACLAQGLPVLIGSRCPEGRTRAVYGNDSGAHTLIEAGALLVGDLSPLKARLLLAALLARGVSGDQLKATLNAYC